MTTTPHSTPDPVLLAEAVRRIRLQAQWLRHGTLGEPVVGTMVEHLEVLLAYFDAQPKISGEALPPGGEVDEQDPLDLMLSGLDDPTEKIVWPKGREVSRIGDMHPDAHLRIGFDNDNDVYLEVWDGEQSAALEFCNGGGGGGGQSTRTRLALIALMVAIEADNAEKPHKDWHALRASNTLGWNKG